MSERLDFYKASPEAIKAMMGLEQRVAKSSLEKPLIELVRLRASQINGCAYCMDMHSSDARKGGENDRRLAVLSAWQETSFFSERERAALLWTEALTLIGDRHVPDAVWNTVSPHFTEQEIADLTLLIIAINGWNRFAIAFRKAPAPL